MPFRMSKGLTPIPNFLLIFTICYLDLFIKGFSSCWKPCVLTPSMILFPFPYLCPFALIAVYVPGSTKWLLRVFLLMLGKGLLTQSQRLT